MANQVISVVLGGILFAAAGFAVPAQGVCATPSTEIEPVSGRASPDINPPMAPETMRIEKVGAKVGRELEQFEASASSRVGNWIDAKVLYGISWLKMILCLALLFLVLVVERGIRWLIHRRMDAIPKVDGVTSWTRVALRALVRPLSLLIWIYGIYAAFSPVYPHFESAAGANLVHTIIRRATDIGAMVSILWFLYGLVAIVDSKLLQWAAKTESSIDDMMAPLVGKTLRIFIIVIGGMVVLQNATGIEIGPLVASLGIGGLAVALAAKDSIANFFGTLTILFDKPFQVGERIVVDKYDGVVEKVGFRSTRIRTLAGHLVTLPNEKLVNSSMENISKRPHIRWLTNIGITYDTPPDKVEKAVAAIKEILDNHEGMHPDFPPRVVFNGFHDWSLNIMVVVWYHPPDYWNYQAWLEKTCLAIMRRFQEEGIDFAFPSRTLYLAGDARRQLKMELMQAAR